MIRASRLALMTMIVRAGAGGYYVRGNDGFAWLRAHGLAEWVDRASLTHRLTDKGLVELRSHGICDRCGGHGTYRTGDYVTPWAECDHVATQAPSKTENAG
jgi:hypothetical protein